MKNLGLAVYFIASYSIGLVSLVISLASYLKRRGRAARDFFVVSSVFAIIVANSMVMNLIDSWKVPLLMALLGWINHACAAALIVALPLLAHSVHKPERERALNRGFLALACATVLGAVAFVVSGSPDSGGRLILGVKDFSLLYVIVRILSHRRRRHDGEMENVLYFTTVGTVLIYPVILASELAPALFGSILPIEARGSLTLPLVYSLWGASYLLSWLKGYVRPLAAGEVSYRDFSARFGLSPREGEVLRLLLGGQSYKEIMSSLSISMPTVKSHVGSIYRKTDCNNKMQLSLLFSPPPHTKV